MPVLESCWISLEYFWSTWDEDVKMYREFIWVNLRHYLIIYSCGTKGGEYI